MTSIELAKKCALLADDKKGQDILILDLAKHTSFTNYFVICSANSERQTQAIADHIERSLRDEGEKPIGSEGQEGGNWIILDYGDVIVHVFSQGAREYYDLERFWASAPQIKFNS